jgi:hypothetical protein
MELSRWNNADPNPGARSQTSVFRGDKGLDVANKNRASGEGRRMFLTSPYIDQAFTLKTSLLSVEGVLVCTGSGLCTPRRRDHSAHVRDMATQEQVADTEVFSA